MRNLTLPLILTLALTGCDEVPTWPEAEHTTDLAVEIRTFTDDMDRERIRGTLIPEGGLRVRAGTVVTLSAVITGRATRSDEYPRATWAATGATVESRNSFTTTFTPTDGSNRANVTLHLETTGGFTASDEATVTWVSEP